MRRRARFSRVVAFGLVLGLPAVTGARLGLDAQMTFEVDGHVESEHVQSCVWGHDHRLCVLVYRAPWSPGPEAPQIAQPAPPSQTSPHFDEPTRSDLRVRLPLARSPPDPT